MTGSWVLVSPQRTARPWQGRCEDIPAKSLPTHDPECYLCPGNRRADGATNPDYDSTYAFDNDFPALLEDAATVVSSENRLLVSRPESGICRVICFSPRHDLTLAGMVKDDIRKVIDLWTDEYRSLGTGDQINYVQIFENKGELMGCSNPHPHGQIWAQRTIPDEPAKELANMLEHYDESGRPVLMDYLDVECREDERVVCANESFLVVVPFWAVWPFETMVLPRRQVASLLDLTDHEKSELADIVGQITARYDRLFRISFPYSSGIHQAPTDGGDYPHCTLHLHFYPPLLRSATVRKFMVGYEMLAEAQRDVTPETSAKLLRELAAA